jgi:hypothetical protein
LEKYLMTIMSTTFLPIEELDEGKGRKKIN